jgi:nucleotide-binding universal stress UspA family protein
MPAGRARRTVAQMTTTAKAIADVANVRGADEIILGTRGFGRVRALLGSVAHEVIHLAACPVIVIPEQMVACDAAAAAAESATVLTR